MKFYECKHCGNIIMFLRSSGVLPVCCGDSMKLMDTGVTDGAGEKHVPLIIVNGDRVIVKVGEKPHPMTAEHHIEFIVLETTKGLHITKLINDIGDGACVDCKFDKAEVGFTLQEDEQVLAAYEMCNLHGLWAKSLDYDCELG